VDHCSRSNRTVWVGAYLWVQECLGFEPRVIRTKVRFTTKVRQLGHTITPEKTAGWHSVCVIPWHSPYNWGKGMEQPQLGLCWHCHLLQVSSTSLFIQSPLDRLGDLSKPLYSVTAKMSNYGVPCTTFESNLLVKVRIWSAQNGTLYPCECVCTQQN
jgi:hypothetical protein